MRGSIAVAIDVLRESGSPMTAREIAEAAGPRLPTKSDMPENVVARDLSLDMIKRGEASPFIRPRPGLYALRELAMRSQISEYDLDTIEPVFCGDGADLEPEHFGQVALAINELRAHLWCRKHNALVRYESNLSVTVKVNGVSRRRITLVDAVDALQDALGGGNG